MKLLLYKEIFRQSLAATYDQTEIDNFFHIALEAIENKRRLDLILDPDLQATPASQLKWEEVLKSLVQQQPIQYIFEKAHFYGLEFRVASGVLIPRPETEELVSWILDTVDTNKPLRILDIGTGSGCIAIALAKNLPLAQVTALDVSEVALEIARQNARDHGVNVRFLSENILELTELDQPYDLVVSNPPYVRDLEKVEIHDNVKLYEPHLALFVSDSDPLLFYRKIEQLAAAALSPGGALFFEINQYLGAETLDLFSAAFQIPELRRDFMQNHRMIRAQKLK